MKILINHIDNTLNYGSAMMAINLIYRLNEKRLENFEIYCICDDYNFDRLKMGSMNGEIKQFYPIINNKLSIADKLKKYILGTHQSINEIAEKFDFLIVLGGDDLSETYKKGAILKGLVYRSINKKCKVILAGQSFGPFEGVIKLISGILFKRIIILSRDDNSYNFTKEIGVKETLRSRDLALLPLPEQDKFKNSIFEKFPLKNNGYITCVPSGLWRKYHHNLNEYIATWIRIIENLGTRFPDFEIVLMGHVLMPNHANDSIIINEILNVLEPDLKKRVVTIIEPMQPAEARAILGGSYLVLTGRMHAAVSTFFMNKPVISLAYSEKYSGVIGSGLGLNELIIDTRMKSWGRDSEIVPEVEKKVDYILKNYIPLVDKIKIKIEECSKMVNEQINFIIEKIGDSNPTK